MRAGAHGLSLLSNPLDAQVLQALENGPLPLIDLRQVSGLPPQTTLRKHLNVLRGLGLLIRTQAYEFPAPATYELSVAGLELRAAARSVEAWLSTSPLASAPSDGSATQRTIKSLIDAWTTTMLRALVAKPLSLTELDRVLPGIDYPALERRLTAMRLAGLVEAVRGKSRATPYRVTRWLREAAGPLVVTADWENRHGTTAGEPLDRLDVETIFLLAMPLVRISPNLEGTCRLVVDLADEGQDPEAGVAVVVNQGRPVSCTSLSRAEGSTTATGPRSVWLSSLSGNSEGEFRFEGDHALAQAVVGGLRAVLRSQSLDHLERRQRC